MLIPVSLSDRIADEVRDDIINGRLAFGERIKETTISQNLGVSRPPLREALQKLHGEGLIHLVPNKGAFVVNFTDKDIVEIYTIRLGLEPLAAKIFVSQATPKTIEQMRAETKKMEQCLNSSRTNNRRFPIEADLEFHSLLWKTTANQRLQEILERMKTQLLVIMSSNSYAEEQYRTIEEHRQILEMWEKQDPEQAQQIMGTHIQNGMNLILHLFKNRQA